MPKDSNVDDDDDGINKYYIAQRNHEIEKRRCGTL